MRKNEFAPVTPGEMLKEEFVAALRLVAKRACQSDRHFAEPDRRAAESEAEGCEAHQGKPGRLSRIPFSTIGAAVQAGRPHSLTATSSI
jgi:hypothetical protein